MVIPASTMFEIQGSLARIYKRYRLPVAVARAAGNHDRPAPSRYRLRGARTELGLAGLALAGILDDPRMRVPSLAKGERFKFLRIHMSG